MTDPARTATAIDAQVLAPHGRPCPACGCPVEAEDRFCPACGTPTASDGAGAANSSPATTAAQTMEGALAAEVVEMTTTPRQANFFRCQQCGSEVSVDPDQRSYLCPFCDSSYVVEFSPATSGRQAPEFVIGFGVSVEDAQARFREWLASSGWFRPGDLRQAAVIDRLRGVYLPFWTFSMRAESDWSARIGEYWYRTETYTELDTKGQLVTRTRQVRETEWWDLAGRHHRFYSGYLVSGSRGLSQDEAQQIGPFNLPALRRYAPHYLAGWACEEYSVGLDEALQRCQQEFVGWEQSHVANFLPGDTYTNLRVSTDFHQITSDLCLLPVHIVTYRYRDQLYRFLVNGQTGRVCGERPVSWRRILLAVAAGAIAVLLVVAGVLLWQKFSAP